MIEITPKGKRIVLIHWKNSNQVEAFSNLKNFCLSYPKYNYNTLNNYLSKEKIPYENEMVRIERKYITTKPTIDIALEESSRSIAPVLRRVQMKEAADDLHDLHYWLNQPILKRAQAVTFLVSQMLRKGQRIDKTFVNKKKIMK